MEPAPKKRRMHFEEQKPFPNDCKIIGYFSGLDIEVFGRSELQMLGCYGENPRPRWMPHISEETKAIKCERRQDWEKKFSNSPKKQEDPQENETPFNIPDSKVLCPEEAMFLHREIRCLEIRDENGPLTTEEIWTQFCSVKCDFPAFYAAYVYVKSKNWVVKSGTKFGGHFLLYKESPKLFHASYIVKVIVKGGRTILEHQTNERVAENSKKHMLYLEVYYPCSERDPATLYQQLEEFKIKEIAFRRQVVKRIF